MKAEFKTDALMYINSWFFEIFTVWKIENLSNIKKKIWYIYTIIFRILILFIYILPLVINFFIVIQFGDLEVISDSIFIFGTIMLELMKSFNYYKFQDTFREILNDFDNDLFEARDEEEKTIMKNSFKSAKRMYWFIFWSYNCTVVLWALFPILNTSEMRILPVRAWYPFRFEASPVYEILFFFQIIYTTVFATLDCVLDTTISFFIIFISMRTDILLKRLKNGYKGYSEYFKRDNEEVKMNYLKECAILHELIISYTRRLQNIVSKILFAQFSVSCIIICITMLKMTMDQPFTVQFMSTLWYQTCMVAQLFLYSWFGNELTLKCSMISQVAYCSDWYEQGTKYCRTIKFIMMRAEIPVRITGGYFVSLSIEAFTAIIRSSWSYFALLRQVTEKD